MHEVGALLEGRSHARSELIDGKERIPFHAQPSCLFSLGTRQRWAELFPVLCADFSPWLRGVVYLAFKDTS